MGDIDKACSSFRWLCSGLHLTKFSASQQRDWSAAPQTLVFRLCVARLVFREGNGVSKAHLPVDGLI